MLQAVALGLGTVPIGAFRDELVQTRWGWITATCGGSIVIGELRRKAAVCISRSKLSHKKVLKRLRVHSSLIGKVVNLIRERAGEVKIRATTQISLDAKDDPFCFCAEAGKADLIETLNPKDFPQDRLEAKVVSPRHFLGK